MNCEQILENEKVILRALEPEDISLLYDWENDTSVWNVSSTVAPFSKNTLKEYIINALSTDIYDTKQLRFMIVSKETMETIGTIDLYDFDARNRRAGIGIFISKEYQGKSMATNALNVLLDYCKSMLLLHQVFVETPIFNETSVVLFQNTGFQKTGIKKDWLATENGYIDVLLMQKTL